MDAIIPPNGSTQPIVIDDNHRRAHCKSDAPLITDMGLAEIDNTTKVGYHNSAEIHRTANHAAATAERLGLAELQAIDRGTNYAAAEINRTGDNLSADLQRMGLTGLSALERNADRLQASIERHGFNNADKTSFYGTKNFEATKDAEFALRKDILQGNCDIKDKIASNFRDSLLQAANNTAALQSHLTVGFKDGVIEAEKIAAAAQLAMATNTAALQATAAANAAAAAMQLAECCCEIKGLVKDTAQKTEDLVRDLDKERIRDQLQHAREELTALRLRASLTPPLVPAVGV